MKKLTLIILILIGILASVLRFYKLDSVPPSLNWDEVAAGYNAYTIAYWGADEYGNKFPIVFKSFADDKHPVHIYFTALIVKIFGSNDFITRSSSAFIGVVAVIAIFFLAKKLFASDMAGLFASFFLAVSSYHLHYSRGLWEANFAISLFVIGLALFYYKSAWSFLFFGLSFFSYHSAKLVVPPVVLVLILSNFKQFISNKKFIIISLLISLVFGALILEDTRILGFARAGQTKFSQSQVKEEGGMGKFILNNYKKYFGYDYLFKYGDQNPRGSVKVFGEFYKTDLLLIIAGIVYLLVKRKWQALIILSIWLIIAPLPGAISTTEPNSTRGIFMLAPLVLFSAYGATALVTIFKHKWLQYSIVVLILIILSFEFKNYLTYYFNSYGQKDAIEWQYGMKDIVQYVAAHPDLNLVYMDKIRQQPYIFFLYYLKTPLPELLSTAKYDESNSKSFNTVLSYDKYHFGDWDPVESYPGDKILYVITPSYYSGLRFKPLFDVVKLVKYPNGSDAFYLVAGIDQ